MVVYEGEREGERKVESEREKRKKILKTLTSCYSRVPKMRFYYNSVLVFLRFRMFDVSGFFLSFKVLKMLKYSIFSTFDENALNTLLVFMGFYTKNQFCSLI